MPTASPRSCCPSPDFCSGSLSLFWLWLRASAGDWRCTRGLNRSPASCSRCAYRSRGVSAKRSRRPEQQRIAQHLEEITGGLQRQQVDRAAAGDPLIEITRAPVIGGDRVGPITVAAVEL